MLPEHFATRSLLRRRVARSTFEPPSDLRTLESGLDALQSVAITEKGPWRRFIDGVLPPVLLLIAPDRRLAVLRRDRPARAPTSRPDRSTSPHRSATSGQTAGCSSPCSPASNAAGSAF